VIHSARKNTKIFRVFFLMVVTSFFDVFIVSDWED